MWLMAGMTIVVSAAVRRAQLVSVLTLGELLLSTTTNLVLVSMEIRHLGMFMTQLTSRRRTMHYRGHLLSASSSCSRGMAAAAVKGARGARAAVALALEGYLLKTRS